MILVTGGTGLVGSHLLFNLVQKHQKIKAIYRRESTLQRVKKVFSYYTNTVEELYGKIDWVMADLNDIPALEIAFQDITHVYHCAAFVSFEPNKYNQLRKINIEGTANIVNLSITNSVEKICYVSSIAAIGHHLNPETLITEQTNWDSEKDNSVYAITKYGAELEVWRGSQEGLNCVIINPGIILGPGFWKGGGSGSLIRSIHKGLDYYPRGSSAYVDVWDTVAIMQQLMESDINNERYIVIAENRSFKSFQDEVSKSLGVKTAKKEASKFLLAIAWRLDWLSSKISGKRRKLSKQMANSINTKTLYDHSKISKTLNYKFETLNKSIKKTCSYYLDDLES